MPDGGTESSIRERLDTGGDGGPQAPSGETRESLFSKEYFGLLLEDTKTVLTAPARWQKKEWVTFSAAILGIGALAVFDKPVWDFMRDHHTNARDSVANVLTDVGGVYSVAALAPFYFGGKIWGDEKAVRVALDGWASSLVAAGIVVPSMKFLAGRSTPKEEEGTYRFRPFTYRLQLNGGPQSFPSGHAAQGFAIATAIALHYDETWIKVAAYATASLTSAARLYQGEHFLSDWATGALIGTFVGTTVVHFNEKRRAEKREQQVWVLPFLASGGGGITIVVRR